MRCQAVTDRGIACKNDAIYSAKGQLVCGVHSRSIKDKEKITITHTEDIIKEGRIKLCKTYKSKKIDYEDAMYIFLENNNRKKGKCYPSLSFRDIKDIVYNGIKYKTLEDMFYASIKLKDESMEEFKKKQYNIINMGGRFSDSLDIDKYFIGDEEYTRKKFLDIIFDIYKSNIINRTAYRELLSIYKSGMNIIFAGDTAYTTDITSDKPFMAEGMLYNIITSEV